MDKAEGLMNDVTMPRQISPRQRSGGTVPFAVLQLSACGLQLEKLHDLERVAYPLAGAKVRFSLPLQTPFSI
jgi:hypothetical protein